MRILHVTPYFAPAHRHGELGEAVYRQCIAVARAGCDVKVLTTNADGPRAKLEISTRREYVIAAGLAARYCQRRMGLSLSSQMMRLLLARTRSADIVHLTSVHSFPVIPAMLACRLFGKPMVWSPRGDLRRGGRVALRRTWSGICRIAAPSAITLHFTSETERNESMRSTLINAVVIPDGVQLPRISHNQGDGRLRLGYSGRLKPGSGLETVIAAGRLLQDAGVAFSLIIAGGGASRYVARLKSAIAKAGLAANVTMRGHLSAAARIKLFADIDLLVAPASDSFISISEALACEVPVIAGKGADWSRLEKIGCGLQVDNDPASIAAAIDRMRLQTLPEMGRRGRHWMTAEFSWDRAACEMCNCYSHLLHGRPIFADMPEAATRDASF
ncbi:MAG: glycosyltransferase [Candidatus Binataceae bacterium]